MSEEWDLIKIFVDELLAFQEATEMFSQSKAITLPKVTSIFDLLLNQLNTSIFEYLSETLLKEGSRYLDSWRKERGQHSIFGRSCVKR